MKLYIPQFTQLASALSCMQQSCLGPSIGLHRMPLAFTKGKQSPSMSTWKDSCTSILPDVTTTRAAGIEEDWGCWLAGLC